MPIRSPKSDLLLLKFHKYNTVFTYLLIYFNYLLNALLQDENIAKSMTMFDTVLWRKHASWRHQLQLWRHHKTWTVKLKLDSVKRERIQRTVSWLTIFITHLFKVHCKTGKLTSLLDISDGQILIMIRFKSWMNHIWWFDFTTRWFDLEDCDLIWIWFKLSRFDSRYKQITNICNECRHHFSFPLPSELIEVRKAKSESKFNKCNSLMYYFDL